MSTAADKLAELLEEAEQKVSDVSQELEAEKRANGWLHWYRHEKIDADKDPLPVPRLELVLHEAEGEDESYRWVYSLVHEHLLKYHVRIPMGVTTTQGSFIGSGGRPSHTDTPFRDGCHFRHDAEHLKLPAFVVVRGVAKTVEQIREEQA